MLLIIEKDPGFSAKLKQNINLEGLKTIAVDTVEDGLYLLGSMKAELVLANLNAFDDGADLDRLLEQVSSQRLPMLLIEGFPNTKELAEHARSKGHESLITLPFNSRDLLANLNRLRSGDDPLVGARIGPEGHEIQIVRKLGEDAGITLPPLGIGGNLAEQTSHELRKTKNRNALAVCGFQGRTSLLLAHDRCQHRLGGRFASASRRLHCGGHSTRHLFGIGHAHRGVQHHQSIHLGRTQQALHGLSISLGIAGREVWASTASRRRRAVRVVSVSGSTTMPAASRASAARIAGPPALVTTATRRPVGSGCWVSALAMSNISSRSLARITPVWAKSASTAVLVAV